MCLSKTLVALRSTSPHLAAVEVFAAVQTTGREGVSFSRLACTGDVERVTAGSIVDAPLAVVLLVRTDAAGLAVRIRPTEVA